jgi:superfamily II DNA or RNA helicase
MRTLENIACSGHFFQGGRSPLEYFKDCLSVSTQYRRAAGYFSSSIFLAADAALAGFFDRGGHMRIVCSPQLMPDDIVAIEAGIASRSIVVSSLEKEIRNSLENVKMRTAAKILALLVTEGSIEFKIAIKKQTSPGIFHSKVGIFEDALGGRSAFCGSTNETWSGWSDFGNADSFLAKSSYKGPESLADIEELDSYFSQLWSDQLPMFDVRSMPDTPLDQLRNASKGENMQELIEDYKKVKQHEEVKKILESKHKKRKVLMDHQTEVLTSWANSDFIGIIDHVTGAGKTVTALRAINDWIESGRPALILVPSTLLKKQWAKEIRSEIDLEPLFVGGSLGKRHEWLISLSDATRNDVTFGPRITLAVLSSAASPDFIKRLMAGSHLLVVGDEVHTTGQKQSAELLNSIKLCGGRLGLSATYSRFGDAEGTLRIEESFGKPLLPKFTIADAIKAGRLVPYDYHFETCHLTETESIEFKNLTSQIQQAIAREGGTNFSDFSNFLQLLIFKRAKIVKQAEDKIRVARKVLKENYRSGDRWLVYCDDRNQVISIENEIKDLGYPIMRYFDAMAGDKDETLNLFSNQGGILLAIKCLDEGIDIPAATHALILASSQNPREYIQRRGRVLRSNKESGKYKADIFDVLTLDDDDIPVMVNELLRMESFAEDADNPMIKIALEEIHSRIALNNTLNQEFEIDPGLETSGENA